MPIFRRRRRHDDQYYERRPYRGGGNSCLRDACLIESGCCIAESCDGNCLIAGLLTLPHLLVAAGSAVPRTRRPSGLMISAIRVYQREISAKRPAVCRFEPSCSEYAAQAISRHGALRGGKLMIGRLLRCRPGGKRGPDPVP
ncbi:membrane protein insertion efficiency factor YidD [Kutzneria sp. 744]|uniref:membrane protein insertion efficiency factor YidD n=1 Tax=Kutzneria sp. (strain 744) TaxID=345341 RepID=UPI0004AD0D31|nr:membrane protein insertion efficiency factor YidD [Kutzneria sp. 744]